MMFKKLISLFTLIFSLTVNAEVATFAGGCFWCMEPPFEKLEGVSSVISGYMGGKAENAYYKKVSKGNTKHLEVVQVTYNPQKISYEKLLDVFWRNIDPTQEDGQFNDIGPQYKTTIFTHTDEQNRLAKKSKAELKKSKKFKEDIVTEIRDALKFYPAEDYHQDYYKKNPLRYKFYRFNSGRDEFIKENWGSGKKP